MLFFVNFFLFGVCFWDLFAVLIWLLSLCLFVGLCGRFVVGVCLGLVLPCDGDFELG